MNQVAKDLVNQLIRMGCDVAAIGDERYVVGDGSCPPPMKHQMRLLIEDCRFMQCQDAEIVAYLHELGRVEPIEYH